MQVFPRENLLEILAVENYHFWIGFAKMAVEKLTNSFDELFLQQIEEQTLDYK